MLIYHIDFYFSQYILCQADLFCVNQCDPWLKIWDLPDVWPVFWKWYWV